MLDDLDPGFDAEIYADGLYEADDEELQAEAEFFDAVDVPWNPAANLLEQRRAWDVAHARTLTKRPRPRPSVRVRSSLRSGRPRASAANRCRGGDSGDDDPGEPAVAVVRARRRAVHGGRPPNSTGGVP